MNLPVSVLITGAVRNFGAELAARLQDAPEWCCLIESDPNRWSLPTRANRVAGPLDSSVEAVIHVTRNPVAYLDWPELIGANITDCDFLNLMERIRCARLPSLFLTVNALSANIGLRWDSTTPQSVLGYALSDEAEW